VSSVDIELTLVGLVAMLEPATLASSVLALVLGDRPLRTGTLAVWARPSSSLAASLLRDGISGLTS
jgi:hypothetical protein